MITRRLFLGGLGAALAAPAIVRAGSLMPIRGRILLTGDVTYYVAPDGNDLFDGLTPARAIRSMQKVLDRLDLNGRNLTFQLASGTYGENLDSRRSNGEMTLSPTEMACVRYTGAEINTANKSRPVLEALCPSLLDTSNSIIEARYAPFDPLSYTVDRLNREMKNDRS